MKQSSKDYLIINRDAFKLMYDSSELYIQSLAERQTHNNTMKNLSEFELDILQHPSEALKILDKD